jgi:SAM-dependent methyltransferase
MLGGVNLAGRALAYTRERCERWEEAWLDRKYGLQTGELHEDLAALGARGEHLADATAYEAIQIPMFRAMLRAAGVDPGRHLFLDLGCGKGRALILAAERGFRRILGVEFAPRLYRLACWNVDAFRRLRPEAPPIAVHFGDAATYPIPREDAVLFFYHPFGERVMRRVAANIEASLGAARRLVIIYRNPVHCPVLEGLAGLRTIIRNRSFAIYRF